MAQDTVVQFYPAVPTLAGVWFKGKMPISKIARSWFKSRCPCQMKKKSLYGNLPLHKQGINKGRLDRTIICKLYTLTPKELTKAYLNWQDIFRIEGSNLTFEGYLNKLTKTKITPFQVGNNNGQYNLSRYGDKGVYTEDNCRFILRTENLDEQCHRPMSISAKLKISQGNRGKRVSAESRARISTGMKRYYHKKKLQAL